MKKSTLQKKQAARKAPANPPQPSRSAGKLTQAETTKLLLQARDAYDLQLSRGRVEPGQSFDDWRREQVMDCAGVAGISKIERSQWRTVSAHFLTLADKQEEAFKLHMTTGTKGFRPTGPGDTYESSEAIVHHIRMALADHAGASVTHPKGHLHVGWFLACARQRTRKPSLKMETLAERLDAATLTGLLSHLKNHIALREGRATDRRSPRKYPKKPDPGDFDGPF